MPRSVGPKARRSRRLFTDEDIARVADTCHSWRSEADGYGDAPGFCRSAPLDEVRKRGHVLTPGLYVGAPPQEDGGEPFEDKMKRLVAQLREQQSEGAHLDAAIAKNLKALGFRECRA